MGIAEKFNFKGQKQSRVDNTGFEFKSLGDIYKLAGEGTVQVQGFFITKGGLYGDSPVMVLSNCNVNLPKHLLSTVQAILDDAEMLQQVLDGKLGIQIYGYRSEKYHKDCFSVRWVDIVEEPNLFDDSGTVEKLKETDGNGAGTKKAKIRKGLVDLKQSPADASGDGVEAIPF